MGTVEKPLIFRRGDEALEFPARPEGGTVNPPALFSHPIVDTGDWTGVGLAIYSPGSGPANNLPVGWAGRWDLDDGARLETEIQIIPAQWGRKLTLAGKVCPGSPTQIDTSFYWTAEPGHLPIPSESATANFNATIGPDLLSPLDPAAWVPIGQTLEIPDGAVALTILIDAFTEEEGAVFTAFTALEVTGEEPEDAVVWACLPAHDDHLDGLWSLPGMLGEVQDNLLYGGGLAPEAPKYGPRPVTYRLFGSARSRSTLNRQLRRIMAFLAEGRIETDNNGYGFTRDGFLAAPPVIEWSEAPRYQVTATLVMTYLDPAIYGAEGADITDAAAWIAQTAPTRAEGLDYTGHKPWALPTSQEGVPRAVLEVTNDGTLPAWPWIFAYLSPGPYTVDNRAGFAIWKSSDLAEPEEDIVHGELAAHAVWYAADRTLGARWILYSPATGQAYDLDGALLPAWAGTPDYAQRQVLSLAPGETARYIVGAHGGPDTPDDPPTLHDGGAAVLVIAANY